MYPGSQYNKSDDESEEDMDADALASLKNPSLVDDLPSQSMVTDD